MKERFKRKARKSAPKRFLQKFFLTAVMLAIGSFTIFASINTYEVIAHRDLPYSDVITGVKLTNDADTEASIMNSLSSNYKQGSFGIPKKMKLPEAKKHIDIIGASYERGWKASKGISHTFLTANERQKIFGQAIIYMRINTSTTQNLGDVLWGDVVNVVTTEGWQLGYQIRELADDPSALPVSGDAATSEIVVILIDEQTGKIESFRAVLTKVGERI